MKNSSTAEEEHEPIRREHRVSEPPLVASREFDEKIYGINEKRLLKLETRCKGYFLYSDTRRADGLPQKIKKSLGVHYKTKYLRLLYLGKSGIERAPRRTESSEALEVRNHTIQNNPLTGVQEKINKQRQQYPIRLTVRMVVAG